MHFLLFFHSSSGDSTQMHCVDLDESFPTNILNYFLAKFGFDTGENELSKGWPKQASDTHPRS